MGQAADRYAQALFDLTLEKNNLEDIHRALGDINNLILVLNDFRGFLDNPLLSLDERKQVLKALFEGRLPDDAYTFLLFITYKNRLNLLEEMLDAFDALYLSHTHQMRALMQTAFSIEEKDKTAIQQRLEDKFKQHVLIKWEMDPSLLGGFRLGAQGWMYDYSFKNQLNHFYQQTVGEG